MEFRPGNPLDVRIMSSKFHPRILLSLSSTAHFMLMDEELDDSKDAARRLEGAIIDGCLGGTIGQSRYRLS